MVIEKKPSVKEIIERHSARIEKQIDTEKVANSNFSREYVIFKDEIVPELSRFERWCKTLGNTVKLKISEKDESRVRKQLEIAHLDIEPWQAMTLGVMVFLSVFVLGLLISVAVALLKGGISEFPILFFFLVIVVSLFLFYFVNNYPARLANKWRLKASSQMIPAILYIVVYMRHTPNLERAIAFASENLQYPLALDFKKIFYDIEVRKFPTIRESLNNYLETWKDYSSEFIESFHLIESSLFEPDNSKRIQTLEKSLQVALEGVYDKMLKFTHDVRAPLTNVYMLGIVLPVLGLALLPLASSMIGGLIKWYHVFILYTMILPLTTFFLMDRIMVLRPGGYGETEFLERNPNYPKYKSRKPYANAFLICLPFFIIGILPLVFQTSLPSLIGFQNDYTFAELGMNFFGDGKLFDFKSAEGGLVGPFGILALVMGMFFPLGIALFFSISFKGKTQELIKERMKTKQLENEFNNSLFQLGNRMSNGVPPELVFAKVAESSRGLITEDFFRRVNYNIQQMGMSVEKAIFDKTRGAINYYPSELIATSMKVLIESSKKGLNIASVSLMSISQYVKNIQKITDRLRDMLASTISDMKSNMTFLAPLLSGAVVGLASMIIAILNKLNFAEISGAETGIGSLSSIMSIFEITKMIPPYYLQIAIGIYLVEVIFILTGTLVAVDSGEDKLEKMNKSGINLSRGILFYFITAFVATIALFFLTSLVLSG